MSTTNCDSGDGESLRDRKARLTRESIHRAAVRLSYERGLDAATVAQIADEAGISQRTFFNYFASKEDAIIGTATSGPDERLVHDALASADFSSGVLATTADVVRDILSRSLGDEETEQIRRALFMREPALVQRNADAGGALATMLIDALTPRLADEVATLALPDGTTTRDAVRMIVLIALAPLRHSFVRPKPPPGESADEASADEAAADEAAAESTPTNLHERFDTSLALFRTVLEGIRI
ncbi:transcriptional regulator, TetR family [Brevibacterium sp. Mu109]|uniref:TetR/AcrR family transcriptional regulator n=1 Tax=Brevibacterium sp. Mu109 TaxID=1255669 RepID=UPI000C53BAF3|nr:TetR/AcrR family transcriptional regulator [Brevibacterium sp. Mu109]SMX91789.1 transcriptional regulator, TetR family [Brevibacterium sp. Mu109]